MAIAKTLTTKQVQTAFGVAHMTIYTWRKGTSTREPLPFEVDDPKAAKSRVSFKVAALKAWARKHKVDFVVDPQSLLDSDEVPVKPGPKIKAKVAKKQVHATKRTKH